MEIEEKGYMSYVSMKFHFSSFTYPSALGFHLSVPSSLSSCGHSHTHVLGWNRLYSLSARSVSPTQAELCHCFFNVTGHHSNSACVLLSCHCEGGFLWFSQETGAPSRAESTENSFIHLCSSIFVFQNCAVITE